MTPYGRVGQPPWKPFINMFIARKHLLKKNIEDHIKLELKFPDIVHIQVYKNHLL
jgi:hypothetical protein